MKRWIALILIYLMIAAPMWQVHAVDVVSTPPAANSIITALNNQAENRLVTIGSTTTQLDGEANLTFDGTQLVVGGTDSLRIPVGTTAQRPGTPADGDFRINSTTGNAEIYRSAAWRNLETGGGDLSDGDTLVTGLTFPLAGLHILDTNASHDLIFSPGSDLTADRTLTITTGDVNRAITLNGDTTLSGTNTGDEISATTSAEGIVELATLAEVDAGLTPVVVVDAQTLGASVRGVDHSAVTITVAGDANEITVAEGAQTIQASRTFTAGIADNPTLPGTGGTVLNSGTDAQRSATTARVRWNTDRTHLEVYTGTQWRRVDGTHDVINVMDYGAVGDGVADDSTAFTDAIAACGPDSVLYVPAGQYDINVTQIQLSDINGPIGLVGEGEGSEITSDHTTSAVDIDGFAVHLEGVKIISTAGHTVTVGDGTTAGLNWIYGWMRDCFLVCNSTTSNCLRINDAGCQSVEISGGYMQVSATHTENLIWIENDAPSSTNDLVIRKQRWQMSDAPSVKHCLKVGVNASKFVNGLRVEDIEAEQTNGGVASISRTNGAIFRNIRIYDLDTAAVTSHMFWISDTGAQSCEHTTIDNCGRVANGTLAASWRDIYMSNNARNTTIMNCGASSGYPLQIEATGGRTGSIIACEIDEIVGTDWAGFSFHGVNETGTSRTTVPNATRQEIADSTDFINVAYADSAGTMVYDTTNSETYVTNGTTWARLTKNLDGDEIVKFRDHLFQSTYYTGNESYIDLPFQGDATTDYTIDFWFRSGDLAADADLIDLRSATSVGVLVRVTTTGTIRALHNGTGDISTSAGYDDNEWHHVIVTWDSTAQDLVINVDDSAEIVTDATTDAGPVAPSANGRLAARAFTSAINDYPGQLANVQITLDTVLTWDSDRGDEINEAGTNGTVVGAVNRINLAPYSPGTLSGLNINLSTDTDHDIDFEAGEARSNNGRENLSLVDRITKQIDVAWAEQAGDVVAGGLFSGVVANNTTYHLFVIGKDADGDGYLDQTDAGFDTSATAANIPSGYTHWRRVGMVVTDGSANISEVYPVTAGTKGQVLVHDGTGLVNLGVGADTEVITADSTTATGIKWAAAAGGSSEWTDSGTFLSPTETTDEVVIGGAVVNAAKLSVDADADQVQFSIKGNGTQTANYVTIENSGGTDLFVVDQDGAIRGSYGPQLITSNFVAGDGAGATIGAGDVQNVCVGVNAGAGVAMGSRIVCVGYNTESGNSRSDNVIIGDSATTSWNKGVAIGSSASTTETATSVGYDSGADRTGSLALGAYAKCTTAGNYQIALGYHADATAGNQFVVGSPEGPITNAYIGEGVTDSTPQASTTITTTGGSGTDIHATDLTLAPGISTGSATPAAVHIQSTVAGGTGATAQTATNTVTVEDKYMHFEDRGSDPTLPTNRAGLYGKDVAGTVEMFAIDEAGNASPISPHDPLTGEWIFQSTNVKTGRVLKVRMEALVKRLAEKYPEDFAEFVEESAPLAP